MSDAYEPREPFQASDFGDAPEGDDSEATPERSPLDAYGELSLSQMIGELVRAPRSTLAALWTIAQPGGDAAPNWSFNLPRRQQANGPQESAEETPTPEATQPNEAETPVTEPEAVPKQPPSFPERRRVQLGFYLTAVLLGAWATASLVGAPNRTEDVYLFPAAPLMFLAVLLWVLADLIGNWREILARWQSLDRLRRYHVSVRCVPGGLLLLGVLTFFASFDAPRETIVQEATPAVALMLLSALLWFTMDVVNGALGLLYRGDPARFPDWVRETLSQREQREPEENRPRRDPLPWYMRVHPVRVFVVLAAAGLSIVTWLGTSNNHMDTLTFYLWLLSVILWAFALTSLNWHPADTAQKIAANLRAWRWRDHAFVILTLTLITLVAAFFRLVDLQNLPPEMTSDHVEKILDGWRTLNGQRSIFFANNGGREPFQMYALGLMSTWPGLGINFTTLKLLAVLEALISIPFLYWMGRELVGPQHKRLGILTGLVLAALIAVSYWHVVLTRLSLRIILTPLVTALLLIYLVRAMRYNQRSDFIKAGLVLGFGLYTYQAVRMLPIVVVIGVGLMIWFGLRRFRDRWRAVANLAVLVFISFMAFLPLAHYWVDYPDLFWRRTAGRLLGDDVIQETMPDGTIVERAITPLERLEAFQENISNPTLTYNIRNAFLMFHWKGDVAWINGAPNHPTLDAITGALLLVGVAAWTAFALRQRDPALWLIPIAIFVMLLPSALSIAYPVENPSHTRTSGALPMVYLLAAFPLALIMERILQALRGRSGQVIAFSLGAAVMVLAYVPNSAVIFGEYRRSYLTSSLPYTEPGEIIRGFAISGGSYGNAFMIAYPFWWDHRALGINAGRPGWPNGIVSLSDVPLFLNDAYFRTGDFRLDPERDLLFFYHLDDEETHRTLQGWFPTGYATRHDSYQEGEDFMIYRVPRLGEDGFAAFIDRYAS